MEEIDLAAELGASEEASFQVLTLYIPSRDASGVQFDSKVWTAEAVRILSDIGGGATTMPPAEGAWLNPETKQLVVEDVTVAYTYVRSDDFKANRPRLREFLHRMGRETGQGEVACEFDGMLYRIRHFDDEETS